MSIPTEPSAPPPTVGLRLVTKQDDATRRIDIALAGSQAVLVEDGVETAFETEQLWLVLRDLLPAFDHLRANPRGRPVPPPRAAPEGFAESCRAFVSIATMTSDDEKVAVRSWLATDEELWAVGADGAGVRPAADGELADLLVWDVTAAFEALLAVRQEKRAS
jgi:hypothetical protein